MSENSLIKKYSHLGILSVGGQEIYLPFETREMFVKDCTELSLAIIGLDFFSFAQNVLIARTDEYDFSSFLEERLDWIHLVEKCNQTVLMALNKEYNINKARYYNPTAITKSESGL